MCTCSYSWWPMFVDCQEFGGSCGHTFVGNCFFFCITMQGNSMILLIVRVDVNSWVRVSHKIHKHWSPTNNEDSTVIKSIISYDPGAWRHHIHVRCLMCTFNKTWSHLTNNRRRYMAEILPIRHKTLSNQSINQTINKKTCILAVKIFNTNKR